MTIFKRKQAIVQSKRNEDSCLPKNKTEKNLKEQDLKRKHKDGMQG